MFNWLKNLLPYRRKLVPVVDDMGWTNTDKMRKKTKAIKNLADKYLDQVCINGTHPVRDTVIVEVQDLYTIWDQAKRIEDNTLVVEKYE